MNVDKKMYAFQELMILMSLESLQMPSIMVPYFMENFPKPWILSLWKSP